MEKVEQVLNIFPELADTVITDLLKELERREFVEIHSEIKPDDTIVGQMNDLEKAAHNCSEIFRIALKQEFSSDRPDEKKLSVLKEKFECFSAFMWTSIKDRFSDKSDDEHMMFGIREGFQVVIHSEPERRDRLNNILIILS